METARPDYGWDDARVVCRGLWAVRTAFREGQTPEQPTGSWPRTERTTAVRCGCGAVVAPARNWHAAAPWPAVQARGVPELWRCGGCACGGDRWRVTIGSWRWKAHGAALHQRMEVVQDALSHMHQQVQLLLAGRADDEQRSGACVTVWACDCAARLGIYDAEADQLRVRYKDRVLRDARRGRHRAFRAGAAGLDGKLRDTRETARTAGNG